MTAPDPLEEALREQVAYYRARASEYDLDMWHLEDDPALAEEFEALARWLEQLPLDGRVLELACGTGRWTVPLADRADEVVAVDAAPEMIEIARTKVAGRTNVRLVVTDLYDWSPEGRFDAVWLSFLLSHVPDERMPALWSLIGRALRPGGVAAFVDEAPSETEHEEPVDATGGLPIVRRRLRDGSEHRLIKVFRSAQELTQLLAGHGWNATVELEGARFMRGVARRRPLP